MRCEEFMSLLDAYIDGELDDVTLRAMREHADACPNCREELDRAERLQDILMHMDDGISVPLEVQAGWRKSIRLEAKLQTRKKIYRYVAGIAAAVLVVAGVFAVGNMRSFRQTNFKAAGSYVETDGITAGESVDLSADTAVPSLAMQTEYALEEAEMEMQAESAPLAYYECTIKAEDVNAAMDVMEDLITEYEVAEESVSKLDTGVVLFLRVSRDNCEEFISALSGVSDDVTMDNVPLGDEEAEATVGLRVTIQPSGALS